MRPVSACRSAAAGRAPCGAESRARSTTQEDGIRGCTTCRMSCAYAADTLQSESAATRYVRRIEEAKAIPSYRVRRWIRASCPAQVRLEPVSLLRQAVGEVDRGRRGLVLGQAMLGDEAREEGAVAAARDVVTRRNREERPCVVVEADGVVEAGGLGRLLAEAAQTLGAVVKPPGGTELEHRVVTGEGRQLPAVGRLIEGEKDHREARVAAEALEQRLQRMDIVGALRNVGSLVAAVPVEEYAIVIAHGARMDLHHQTVVDAHRGHLGEHLCAEELRVSGTEAVGDDAAEERLRLTLPKVGGGRARMPMIARGGAERDEGGAAQPVGLEISPPGMDVPARHPPELGERLAKELVLRVDDRIRAVGADHPTRPAAAADRLVRRERIGGAFRRGQHLDVEFLEERPRAKGRARERGADGVEVKIRRPSLQAHRQAEHLRKHLVEPERRG